MRIAFTLFFLQLVLSSTAQKVSVDHQLENQIIRSFCVYTDISLVGIKGSEPGTGLVYIQKGARQNWAATNSSQALAPEVEDVQAVAVVTEDIFLAGTWKNGLFRTDNGGDSWYKLDSFPAADVRSIKLADSNPNLIFAATVSHGIMKSEDLGNTWVQCAADSLSKGLASWKIFINPVNDQSLFALTFANGIQFSFNQGETWKTILRHDGVMFYDLAISENNPKLLYAAGSGDSVSVIYTSENGGETWRLIDKTPSISFNQIALSGTADERVLAGSWDQGLFISRKNKWKKLKEVPFETISGIFVNGQVLTVFTWGDGIYQLHNW